MTPPDAVGGISVIEWVQPYHLQALWYMEKAARKRDEGGFWVYRRRDFRRYGKHCRRRLYGLRGLGL